MATPRVAHAKTVDDEAWASTARFKHTPGKKPSGSVRDPNDVSHYYPNKLKMEISRLWHERKINRYQLGMRLAQLQVRMPHGKFLPVLTKELRIPIHTAYRAMKYFRRIKLRLTEQILQSAKFREKFQFDDVAQFERAVDSKEADENLKALTAIADVEREKVKTAHAKSKGQPAGYKVTLAFSNGQKKNFKKAWDKLTDRNRTTVVYKAVLNAAR